MIACELPRSCTLGLQFTLSRLLSKPTFHILVGSSHATDTLHLVVIDRGSSLHLVPFTKILKRTWKETLFLSCIDSCSRNLGSLLTYRNCSWMASLGRLDICAGETELAKLDTNRMTQITPCFSFWMFLIGLLFVLYNLRLMQSTLDVWPKYSFS